METKETQRFGKLFAFVFGVFLMFVVASVFTQLAHPEKKGVVLSTIITGLFVIIGTLTAIIGIRKSKLKKFIFFSLGLAIVSAISKVFNSIDAIKLISLYIGSFLSTTFGFKSEFFNALNKLK